MASAIFRVLACLAVTGLLAVGIVAGTPIASAHSDDWHPRYSDQCADGANYFHVGEWYWLPGRWVHGHWHDAHWAWCMP